MEPGLLRFSFRFRVTLLSTGQTISYGTSLSFTVTTKSDYIGRSEDRLEMILEDMQMKKHIMIARSLRVTVGSKADHEFLKSKAPYVPRQRTERPPESNVVQGEPAPALNAIPYKGRLTLVLIPKYLTEQLETGAAKDIIQNLKSLYLPAVVNNQTYSRHFKHLLWAEEVQMEWVLVFSYLSVVDHSNLDMIWNAMIFTTQS